jgi:hypothetical protein
MHAEEEVEEEEEEEVEEVEEVEEEGMCWEGGGGGGGDLRSWSAVSLGRVKCGRVCSCL